MGSDPAAAARGVRGKLRQERLNTHWFAPLSKPKETIEAWGQEYNKIRLYRVPGERMPNEYAKEIAARRDSMGQQTTENSPQNWYKEAGRSSS
jgi:hypothetical protein